ncbi:transmembrane channel-like protein 2-B [Electrophorus electricus]|uniref:transmembrane channel-like protein 2-B n=1 Tax=Electrophorus electricus TaxID=8005 RepID=UPI0015D0C2F8|nr:transmembrane channel-like protein 2-B [Electrophorus electricus]
MGGKESKLVLLSGVEDTSQPVPVLGLKDTTLPVPVPVPHTRPGPMAIPPVLPDPPSRHLRTYRLSYSPCCGSMTLDCDYDSSARTGVSQVPLLAEAEAENWLSEAHSLTATMPLKKSDIVIAMTKAGMEMDAEYDSESDEYCNVRAKGNKEAKHAVCRKTQWWAADSEEEEGSDGRRDARAKTAGEKGGARRRREEEEEEERDKGGKETCTGKNRRKGNNSSSSYSSSDSNSESLSGGELTQLQEELEEKKKLISTLRSKPWHMKRRLHSLKKAQEFVEASESVLGSAKGTNTRFFKTMINKKLIKFNLELENLKTMITPWQGKIKEVESQYGSSVASYFIFLRWMYVVNLVPFVLVVGLIIIPETLWGVPYGTIPRKTVPRNEQANAMDFDVLYEYGGYLKYSAFFYGYYDNKEKIGFFGYHLPLAYLLVGLVIFFYILVVVIRVMAKNASEANSIGDEDAFKFSWNVFTSWEYLIGNTETAEEKSAAITFVLKESLVDELRHFKNEDLNTRLFLRFVANVLILSCLMGSGYLIYSVAKRHQTFSKMDRNQVSWLQKNEVEIVISLLGMFCPALFETIAELEDYHPRIALKWQLGRLFALFVGNIYTFVFTIIEDITDQLQVEKTIKNQSIIALQQYYANYTLHHNVTENIPPPNIDPADVIRGPCWETQVGIGFMKLIISDIQVTYINILITDTIRAVVVRYLNYCWCWDLEATFPCYGQFDISTSVLGIIFNQGMVLMGTFYCPGLMSVNILRLVISMYFQCWTLKSSNIPNRNIFKASRTSNIYMGILLFVLFVCLIPVIVIIMTMLPSFDCGPFSGKNKMYDVLTDMILEFPAFMKTFVNFVFNPGVVMSVLILMALIIYYLQKVSTGYHKTNMELKKRLEKVKEKKKKYRTNKVMNDEKDVLSDRALISEHTLGQ